MLLVNFVKFIRPVPVKWLESSFGEDSGLSAPWQNLNGFSRIWLIFGDWTKFFKRDFVACSSLRLWFYSWRTVAHHTARSMNALTLTTVPLERPRIWKWKEPKRQPIQPWGRQLDVKCGLMFSTVFLHEWKYITATISGSLIYTLLKMTELMSHGLGFDK